MYVCMYVSLFGAKTNVLAIVSVSAFDFSEVFSHCDVFQIFLFLLNFIPICQLDGNIFICIIIRNTPHKCMSLNSKAPADFNQCKSWTDDD